MKAILGLGNPGPRYRHTWHNLGFWIIDGLAARHGVNWKTEQPYYQEGLFQCGSDKVFLVKPLTFVNLSGRAAHEFVNRHQASLDTLLVISDEWQLPFGQIRVRARGSSGGHNGLEDIIARLGSENFPRMRCGIGRSKQPRDLAKHVLTEPSPSEAEQVKRIIEEAVRICEDWIQEGTEETMNRYNGRKGIL